MGRPPSMVEDYHEWQRRLERYHTSESSLDVFCLQEGVSRSTFYRWKRRLIDGIPELPEAESAEHQQTESLFLPISLKSSRVEIELPNGGVVRLPGDVDRSVLTAVVRVIGSLRPWKAPQS
jgi:transposase-like protein